jgi:uncharacterized protein DUF3465
LSSQVSSSTTSNADLARRGTDAPSGRQHPAVVALRGLVFCAVVAASCGATVTGNLAVERAFAEHRSEIEVTAQGSVTRLLSDDTGPTGTHQRFIIRLAGATQTVLVTNNIEVGKRVPLAVGDEVVVHGEYIWNDEGGLVHFTHHDPDHTHEDGWIELRGLRYTVIRRPSR